MCATVETAELFQLQGNPANRPLVFFFPCPLSLTVTHCHRLGRAQHREGHARTHTGPRASEKEREERARGLRPRNVCRCWGRCGAAGRAQQHEHDCTESLHRERHLLAHIHFHPNATSSLFFFFKSFTHTQMRIIVSQQFLDTFNIAPTIVETAGLNATVCKSPSDPTRLQGSSVASLSFPSSWTHKCITHPPTAMQCKQCGPIVKVGRRGQPVVDTDRNWCFSFDLHAECISTRSVHRPQFPHCFDHTLTLCAHTPSRTHIGTTLHLCVTLPAGQKHSFSLPFSIILKGLLWTHIATPFPSVCSLMLHHHQQRVQNTRMPNSQRPGHPCAHRQRSSRRLLHLQAPLPRHSAWSTTPKQPLLCLPTRPCPSPPRRSPHSPPPQQA